MNQSLVYTNENCQGCNRCISVCPVLTANYSVQGTDEKQKIEVHGTDCISCGACFEACEHKARSFRDDTAQFFADLKRGEKISVLIAPAFLANYPEEYGQVLGGLKKLGVQHFISVSFGADITTWGYINYIVNNDFSGGISQPCPAIVNYIEHYRPDLIPKLVPIHSPMMCAAIYAKKYMGIKEKLAFISPCIAKKSEISDPNTYGYISYNLTFDHLMEYVRRNHIVGENISDEIEYGLGSVYPMPGGLKENVYWFCGEEMFIRQVEGKKHAYEFLEDYEKRVNSREALPFMVDILNCDKGCIYGTGIEAVKNKSENTFYLIQKIRSAATKRHANTPFSRNLSPKKRLALLNRKFSKLDLNDFVRQYTDKSSAIQRQIPSNMQLDTVFTKMKKQTDADRSINCGACGYDSCREMAIAIFNGCNSPSNCVHFIKNEVQEFSDKISEQNQDMLQRTQDMANFVEQDFQNLNNSIDGMMRSASENASESSAISGSMNEIMRFCDNLNQNLEGIGRLLEILENRNNDIANIAKETNLLSMNASVEAARSGDAGKSFAVVAHEIKKLSDSSQVTAQECEQNQVEIGNAIQAIREEAKVLTKEIAEINNRLTTLTANTEEIAAEADTVREISCNVKNQLENLNRPLADR